MLLKSLQCITSIMKVWRVSVRVVSVYYRCPISGHHRRKKKCPLIRTSTNIYRPSIVWNFYSYKLLWGVKLGTMEVKRSQLGTIEVKRSQLLRKERKFLLFTRRMGTGKLLLFLKKK